MTKEHTPTPWYSIGNDIYHESEYGSDPIASVCGECSFTQDQANSTHIVKCVNMHDELVGALTDISRITKGDISLDSKTSAVARLNHVISLASQTLKKAGAL